MSGFVQTTSIQDSLKIIKKAKSPLIVLKEAISNAIESIEIRRKADNINLEGVISIKLILRKTLLEDDYICEQVSISDNGIGLKASAGRSTGTGTGLKVLMQTIHLLNTKNQEKIEFQVLEQNAITPDSPGTIVEIKIPINFSYII